MYNLFPNLQMVDTFQLGTFLVIYFQVLVDVLSKAVEIHLSKQPDNPLMLQFFLLNLLLALQYHLMLIVSLKT